MELNASFLLLLVLVANSYCAPFGFGAGVGGQSHTTWGADAEGNAGLAEDDIGMRIKGRAGGNVKSVASVTGGAYVASKDGTGLGIGGTSVFDNGVGIDAGAAGRAGLDTESMQLFGETKGYLDKEAHTKLSGNLDFYDADKLKNLVATGSRRDNMADSPTKSSRAFDSW